MVQDFMSAAVAAACEGVARQDGGPFGAVVVRNGQILARACNQVIRDQDPTAHAEVNAIRGACRALGRFHLEDCDLYTSCEPCPMCLGAIYWARLRTVFYAATRNDAASLGFSDAAIYAELSLPPSARSVSFVKQDAAAALAMMRVWQADADKHVY
jgi:tRNA(Arg) A34 adenosine deaminase TadA